ncbi:hypothetical protein [Comamonas testosteroni]|uniref:hypothetical protein n=1 Tax=Comamonas testosteroni TaxID=285 RepID=UPI0015FB8FF6|nr:hypothetical protein [Comamonas testosteroni]
MSLFLINAAQADFESVTTEQILRAASNGSTYSSFLGLTIWFSIGLGVSAFCGTLVRGGDGRWLAGWRCDVPTI